MPRLVAECDIRLTEAKDGPDLARELAEADALVARRDYVGRATPDELTSGMRVLAYDPYVQASELAQLVSLEDVLRESDFISLHPVLTPETSHLINASRLALMKPTAYLINTSRGGVIDEPALIEALRQQRLAGAGLDVFETEPPAIDNPLLHMDNVIGTPHGLSHADESLRRCASMTEENVLAIVAGREPPYIVNPRVRWRVLQRA